MKYILLIITLTGFISQPRAAENQALKYQKCIGLVTKNPDKAITYADDWIFGGNGQIPAGHCKALGLLTLGKAKKAAILLEKLVDDMTINQDHDPRQTQKNTRLRLELNIQTALAWKQAGEFNKAYIAYSSALSGIDHSHSLAKDNQLIHDLYLARGTLQILRRQYQAAIGDFTAAIEKKTGQFDAFLQRAKAYRKKHDYPGARLDLRMAGKLAPDQMDVLLESGILYRVEGRELQARQEWKKIIALYPKSEYAKLARTNLDLLTPE